MTLQVFLLRSSAETQEGRGKELRRMREGGGGGGHRGW